MVSLFSRFSRQHPENVRSTQEVGTISDDQISHSPYIMELNDKQMSAVMETEGYVRVVAGAGSGKTKTLTSRVAYLINDLGVAPDNILCVTFTNKAAKEMRTRVTNYLGDSASGVLIMTFGSLEARIIREDGRVIGFPINYQIIDEEDSKRILANLLKETKEMLLPNVDIDDSIKIKYLKEAYVKHSDRYAGLLMMALGNIHDSISDAEKVIARNGYSKDLVVEYTLLRYVYEKRKSFACDFTDLPHLCLAILKKSDIARDKWQDKLKYIMVDEYQDISALEVDIIEILQEKYKNLFVVGDSDQTIYSFRGSKVEHFVDFDKTFIPTKTILLTKNYRSGAKILDASNTLVKKNTYRIEKDLTPYRQEKGEVVYFHAKTVYEEGDFVAHNIRNMNAHGLPYSDICVLYRAHHVTRVIEEKLLSSNIPYKVYSGIGFYQRKEIKDILAYMRLLTEGDDISFTRVINEPRRQAGPKTLKKIKVYAEEKSITLLEAYLYLITTGDSYFTYPKKRQFAKAISTFRQNPNKFLSAEHPLSDLMMYILKEVDYEESLRTGGEEERLDNLSEFKQSLMDYENSLEGEPIKVEDYLQNISLLTSQDLDNNLDRVNLMTVHAAKGLEFPVVFVVALNEGIFPSSKIRKMSEMEEERRLAYVAFTRAKDQLILSDAEGVSFDGSTRYPSRFIFDAERASIDYLVPLGEDMINSYNTRPVLSYDSTESVILSTGDIVMHKVFGRGVVTELSGEHVAVEFDSKENLLLIRKDALSKVR